MCAYLEWQLGVAREGLEEFEGLVKGVFGRVGPYAESVARRLAVCVAGSAGGMSPKKEKEEGVSVVVQQLPTPTESSSSKPFSLRRKESVPTVSTVPTSSSVPVIPIIPGVTSHLSASTSILRKSNPMNSASSTAAVLASPVALASVANLSPAPGAMALVASKNGLGHGHGHGHGQIQIPVVQVQTHTKGYPSPPSTPPSPVSSSASPIDAPEVDRDRERDREQLVIHGVRDVFVPPHPGASRMNLTGSTSTSSSSLSSSSSSSSSGPNVNANANASAESLLSTSSSLSLTSTLTSPASDASLETPPQGIESLPLTGYARTRHALGVPVGQQGYPYDAHSRVHGFNIYSASLTSLTSNGLTIVPEHEHVHVVGMED